MADDAGNLLQRKRVRFEDTADPEDGDDGAGQQRTRLPIKAAPQELAIEDFSAEGVQLGRLIV